MKATVEIDDALLSEAKESTGVSEISALVKVALEVLVRRESARKLADLGGTMPGRVHIPRRRPDIR